MEMVAKIHRIDKIEQNGYNFKNRFFYTTHIDNTGRKQYLKFKLSQGNVGLVEGFKPGDEIKINFNLEGNEVTNEKDNPKIFDRKEVYNIQGITETIPEEEEDESIYYKLEEGEEDEELNI